MSGHGVIVELNKDQSQVKVFDFTQQSLRVFPNCNNYLGQFCKIGRNKLYSADAGVIVKGVMEKFTVKKEAVQIDTYVICAKSDTLSDGPLKEKYADKAWSPYLGFVRDPKGMLADSFQKGRRHEVTVVYSPTEGTLFDVVDVKNFKTKSKKVVQLAQPRMTTRSQTKAKRAE
ncbi:hypothetical protein CAEBREN_13552 [Caenorhabditis brenneri]|uniref:DUF7038 domain-containing protein n=1 Tax=Caenorhabditis brenneri TaxID=135651 RepID=G0NIL6_CAEBE|nr:hypothetical protein CAEBREN_13552 [Caenorhabditis brenneri]